MDSETWFISTAGVTFEGWLTLTVLRRLMYKPASPLFKLDKGAPSTWPTQLYTEGFGERSAWELWVHHPLHWTPCAGHYLHNAMQWLMVLQLWLMPASLAGCWAREGGKQRKKKRKGRKEKERKDPEKHTKRKLSSNNLKARAFLNQKTLLHILAH